MFLDASYGCIVKVHLRGHSFYRSSTFYYVFECYYNPIILTLMSYNRIYIFILYLYLYHSHASLFGNLNACDLGKGSTALCELRNLYQMSSDIFMCTINRRDKRFEINKNIHCIMIECVFFMCIHWYRFACLFSSISSLMLAMLSGWRQH